MHFHIINVPRRIWSEYVLFTKTSTGNHSIHSRAVHLQVGHQSYRPTCWLQLICFSLKLMHPALLGQTLRRRPFSWTDATQALTYGSAPPWSRLNVLSQRVLVAPGRWQPLVDSLEFHRRRWAAGKRRADTGEGQLLDPWVTPCCGWNEGRNTGPSSIGIGECWRNLGGRKKTVWRSGRCLCVPWSSSREWQAIQLLPLQEWQMPRWQTIAIVNWQSRIHRRIDWLSGLLICACCDRWLPNVQLAIQPRQVVATFGISVASPSQTLADTFLKTWQ